MKALLLVACAIACIAAPIACAGDFTFGGSAAFDEREYDQSARRGIEQKLTMGWQRTFFRPISLRLLFRGEDFRGTVSEGGAEADSHTRRYQPVGELTYAVSSFAATLRHDSILGDSTIDDRGSHATTQRTSMMATWGRERLPTFSLRAQRNRFDGTRVVDDDTASGAIAYSRGTLQMSGTSQVGHVRDTTAGYERTTTTNGALLDWHGAYLDNRLTAAVSGSGMIASYDQRALDPGGTSVPFPVTILRASTAVDETPGDGRDRPLTSNPALIDGSINTPAGVSLGPDGVSFQNLAIELGRTETLDEIRLVARDERGNPVQRVGIVTFDIYTSEDGLLWSPLANGTSTWVGAVSYYAITFEQTRSRWFKVVTFGLNPEPVYVTEFQAFYHRRLEAGQSRETRQRQYSGQASVGAIPMRHLALSYTTRYNTSGVEERAAVTRTQHDVMHEIGADVTLPRGVFAGASITRHDVDATGQEPESDGAVSAYVRALPSRRLEVGADFTRRNSERSFESYTVDTLALHSKLELLASLNFVFDAGTDTLTSQSSGTSSSRQFIDLRTDAHLYRSLRLLLSLTSQRTSSQGGEISLLGRRDDRAYADLTWTPSSLLLLRARYGWLGSEERSAITQQYFVDWNPLQGGSLVIGGSHEEDFDPYTNRRSSRTTFRPRWFINSFTTLDISYYAFRTVIGEITSHQRTIYASMSVTRK